MDAGTISFWIGAALTWVIVMLGIVLFSRFYKAFQQSCHDTETSILGIVGQLQKMQATLTEMLVEQKRMARLAVEQLDLKKAEMTGDFEIIEEPIPQPVEPKPVTLKPAIDLNVSGKLPEIK